MEKDRPEPPVTPNGEKYIIGAINIMLIAILLYLIFDKETLVAALKYQLEEAMNKLWWMGVPLLAIPLIFGSHWVVSSSKAK